MNITSLSPTNVAFRTQTPPAAKPDNTSEQSGRIPRHHSKPTSVVTADASQSALSAAGTLLNTLV